MEPFTLRVIFTLRVATSVRRAQLPPVESLLFPDDVSRIHLSVSVTPKILSLYDDIMDKKKSAKEDVNMNVKADCNCKSATKYILDILDLRCLIL